MISAIFGDVSLFEMWGPFWLILVVGVGYLYNEFIVDSIEYEVTRGQQSLFYTALVLFYLVHGSPFSVIADHYLFSALMLQIALTYFVVVPFLIVGLPFKLFQRYAWNHKLKFSMKVAGHPWLTLVLFNAVFTIYLLPSVFNEIHASVVLSFVIKAFLFIYAFFMWWAIINPVRRLNDLSPLLRLAFIFFAALLLMPIGFYFIVVLDAHFPAYAKTAGEILPAITAVYDQQLAGGILKVIQLSSFIFAMYKIVQAWVWRETDEGHAYDKNVRIVQGVVVRKKDNKE